MSAYTTQALIQTRISAPDILAAFDDLGTNADPSTAINAMIQAVSADIDGRLAAIYDVPFTNPPAFVSAACLTICCEWIYKRRLTPEEKNIFTDEAKMYRDMMDNIVKDKRTMSATQLRSFPPVVSFNLPLSTAGNSR